MRHLFLFLAAGVLCAQDPTDSRDALNQGVQPFKARSMPTPSGCFNGPWIWIPPTPPRGSIWRRRISSSTFLAMTHPKTTR